MSTESKSLIVDPKSDLEIKISTRKAVAGVIGLGYVGLPLVQYLCEAGFRVVGIDIDERKVRSLRDGKSYFRHVSSSWIADTVREGKFSATGDFSRISEIDCVSICVPTPLNKHREPNLEYVEATVRQISKFLRPGHLIVLESTTYPGTTTEVVLPILTTGGLKVGQDFFLAYSPEREDPGNAGFSINRIPKVVGGTCQVCTDIACLYYGSIFKEVVPVDSPEIAEMSKLLEEHISKREHSACQRT